MDFERKWFLERRQREKKRTTNGRSSKRQEQWPSPGRSKHLTRQATSVQVPTKKNVIPSPSHYITVEVPSIDPRAVGSLTAQYIKRFTSYLLSL